MEVESENERRRPPHLFAPAGKRTITGPNSAKQATGKEYPISRWHRGLIAQEQLGPQTSRSLHRNRPSPQIALRSRGVQSVQSTWSSLQGVQSSRAASEYTHQRAIDLSPPRRLSRTPSDRLRFYESSACSRPCTCPPASIPCIHYASKVLR